MRFDHIFVLTGLSYHSPPLKNRPLHCLHIAHTCNSLNRDHIVLNLLNLGGMSTAKIDSCCEKVSHG